VAKTPHASVLFFIFW